MTELIVCSRWWRIHMFVDFQVNHFPIWNNWSYTKNRIVDEIPFTNVTNAAKVYQMSTRIEHICRYIRIIIVDHLSVTNAAKRRVPKADWKNTNESTLVKNDWNAIIVTKDLMIEPARCSMNQRIQALNRICVSAAIDSRTSRICRRIDGPGRQRADCCH